MAGEEWQYCTVGGGGGSGGAAFQILEGFLLDSSKFSIHFGIHERPHLGRSLIESSDLC